MHAIAGAVRMLLRRAVGGATTDGTPTKIMVLSSGGTIPPSGALEECPLQLLRPGFVAGETPWSVQGQVPGEPVGSGRGETACLRTAWRADMGMEIYCVTRKGAFDVTMADEILSERDVCQVA
jgi:hypothetical protein